MQDVLSQGVSLLATHQAVDQSKIDALTCKNKPGLFCRTRGNHVMTDGHQKLGHKGLHVGIVFDQENARYDCAQDAYQARTLTSRAHTFKGRFTLSASKLRGDTATRPRKPVARNKLLASATPWTDIAVRLGCRVVRARARARTTG
jgi:hypothetical protein